ncbi:MAG: hypothetical protein IPP80_10395 [Ignavibacteria bacterium]|nr:hypothetical protein [Ignavibacteria bacterium]
MDRQRRIEVLQIWTAPNARNVEPRYDQVNIGDAERATFFTPLLVLKNSGMPSGSIRMRGLVIAKVDAGTGGSLPRRSLVDQGRLSSGSRVR